MGRWQLGIGLGCFCACVSPEALPLLPPEAQEVASSAALLMVSDAQTRIHPWALTGPTLKIDLPSDSTLEVRTFGCTPSRLAIPDAWGQALGRLSGPCVKEGAPCGLKHFRYSGTDWEPVEQLPNLPWAAARPSPYADLRLVGPEPIDPLIPGAALADLWLSTLGQDRWMAAFALIQGGARIGTQLGLYALTPGGSIELVRSATTSASWIGGRGLPDGSVALLGDHGETGWLDPATFELRPGPGYPLEQASCQGSRAMERPARGVMDFAQDRPGGPLVYWAGTGCGLLMRRPEAANEWQILAPAVSPHSHAKLYVESSARAYFAGATDAMILVVDGDQVRRESLDPEVEEVEGVGLGPDGQIYASGKGLILSAALFLRERESWTPYLSTNLGGIGTFAPIGEGVLLATGASQTALIQRIPGLDYDTLTPRIELDGLLIADLRPLGKDRFAALLFGKDRENGGVGGVAVVETVAADRCDRP